MTIDFHILIKYQGGTIIANSQGNAGHKPAKISDMALATTQQTSDMLDAAGFTDLELLELTPQIGVMQNQLLDAEQDHDEKKISRKEADFKAMLYASMIRACLEHKGTVSDPGILQAVEGDLPAYAEQYHIDAQENYDQQHDFLKDFKSTPNAQAPIQSTQYALLYRKFDRIAELLWMTNRRLGRI